jgi:hypothetical protein
MSWNNWGVRVWTELNWLRVGSCGSCEYAMSFLFHKRKGIPLSEEGLLAPYEGLHYIMELFVRKQLAGHSVDGANVDSFLTRPLGWYFGIAGESSKHTYNMTADRTIFLENFTNIGKLCL